MQIKFRNKDVPTGWKIPIGWWCWKMMRIKWRTKHFCRIQKGADGLSCSSSSSSRRRTTTTTRGRIAGGAQGELKRGTIEQKEEQHKDEKKSKRRAIQQIRNHFQKTKSRPPGSLLIQPLNTGSDGMLCIIDQLSVTLSLRRGYKE